MRVRVAFRVFSEILAASLVNLACETRIALRELDYDTYVCRIWTGRVASDED